MLHRCGLLSVSQISIDVVYSNFSTVVQVSNTLVRDRSTVVQFLKETKSESLNEISHAEPNKTSNMLEDDNFQIYYKTICENMIFNFLHELQSHDKEFTNLDCIECFQLCHQIVTTNTDLFRSN